MSLFLLAGASWVLGTWTLRLAGAGDAPRTGVLRMLAGLCLCAILLLLLGAASFPAARFALYGIAALGLGYEVLLRSAPAATHAEAAPKTGFFGGACLAFAVLGALTALIPATTPQTGAEALASHWPAAAAWAREHHIAPLERDPFTRYATPLHALLAYVLFDGNEFTVRLLSWGVAVCACVALGGLGERVGGRTAGLVAAATLATAPAFFTEARTVPVDLAAAGLMAAGLWAWVAWEQEGRRGLLVASGILLGSAAAVRGIGLTAVAILALATAATPRVGRGPSLTAFTTAAALALAPWWLFGLLAQGPSWPGYPYADGPVDVLALAPPPDPPALRDLPRFPWDLVMRPSRFDDGGLYSPGGLVLFLGLPALIVGGPWARRLVIFSAVGGLALFFVERTPQAYLVFFVPMMAAAALAAVGMPWARRTVAALILVHFAFGLGAGLWILREEAAVAIGREPRTEYLARRVPAAAAYSWIDDRAIPGERVLSLDPRTYRLKTPAYRDYARVAALAELPREERVRWLRDQGIRYLVYPTRLIHDLPGYRGSPLAEVVEEWRASDRVFKRVRARNAPAGDEVEIYRLSAAEN